MTDIQLEIYIALHRDDPLVEDVYQKILSGMEYKIYNGWITIPDNEDTERIQRIDYKGTKIKIVYQTNEGKLTFKLAE